MITLSFLIAACFTLVSPQLALVQHTALMTLYDALGSANRHKERKKSFFLTFLSSGCPPVLCARFAATAPCSGSRLTCSGGNVTAL
jgi:hypothetical protein